MTRFTVVVVELKEAAKNKSGTRSGKQLMNAQETDKRATTNRKKATTKVDEFTVIGAFPLEYYTVKDKI